MKLLSFAFVSLLASAAFAKPLQTKPAPSRPAASANVPNASFPMPIGGAVVRPPERMSDADTATMEVLACEERNDRLQAHVIELEQEVRELRRRANAERAKPLTTRYMMTPTTTVTPDGTLVRPETQKK